MEDEPTAAKAAAKPEKKAAQHDEPSPSSEYPRLRPQAQNNELAPASSPPGPAVSQSSQGERADASSQTEEHPESPGLVQRRSRWYSTMAALRYVSSLSKDDDVRVRDSDRATAIALLISSILTVLSLVLEPLAAQRLTLVLICDALVGLMLLYYVANRFGILNTLNPRQALLTWQLIMGAVFIGIFITINLAVAIALIVSQMPAIH